MQRQQPTGNTGQTSWESHCSGEESHRGSPRAQPHRVTSQRKTQPLLPLLPPFPGGQQLGPLAAGWLPPIRGAWGRHLLKLGGLGRGPLSCLEAANASQVAQFHRDCDKPTKIDFKKKQCSYSCTLHKLEGRQWPTLRNTHLHFDWVTRGDHAGAKTALSLPQAQPSPECSAPSQEQG